MQTGNDDGDLVRGWWPNHGAWGFVSRVAPGHSASILSSVVTLRLAAPLLLVFLAIGMLLGEEGPAGILFGNIQLAHLIGSAALAVILFDGGTRTAIRSFRVALNPAPRLATGGVVIPSGLTGLSPWWWLGLCWLEA